MSFFTESFKFELRGLSGTEEVIIKDATGSTTIILKTTPKEFTVASRQITINFVNDDGPTTKDVFFVTKEEAKISLPDQFESWKCGSSNENHRCDKVRGGTFAWSGTYEIVFIGEFV